MIKSEFTEILENSEVTNEEQFIQPMKEEVEEEDYEDDSKGFETKMEDNLYKDDSSDDMKFSLDNWVEREQLTNDLDKKSKYQKKGANLISPVKKKGPKKCSYCEKIFTTNWNLKMHIQNIHEAIGVPKKCSYCEKVFSSTGNLNK